MIGDVQGSPYSLAKLQRFLQTGEWDDAAEKAVMAPQNAFDLELGKANAENNPQIKAYRDEADAQKLRELGEPNRVAQAGALEIEQSKERATAQQAEYGRQQQQQTLDRVLGVVPGGGAQGLGGAPAMKPAINAKGQVTFTSTPVPAQVLAQQHSADAGLSQYPAVKAMLDTLDKRGQLGPLASRAQEGAIGTGLDSWLLNPQHEKDFTDLKGMLSLVKSNAAMVHGGARGGGSPEIAKRFDELVNAHWNKNAILGGLQAFERWMTKYAGAQSSEDMDAADAELGVPMSPIRAGARGTAAAPGVTYDPWSTPPTAAEMGPQ